MASLLIGYLDGYSQCRTEHRTGTLGSVGKPGRQIRPECPDRKKDDDQ